MRAPAQEVPLRLPSSVRVLSVASLAAVLLATDASAQCGVQKLLSSDSADTDFGRYLDADGDTVAITAGSGVVHVFERRWQAWVEKAKVVVPAPNQTRQSIAIDGDTIALGLPNYSYIITPPGEVAILRRTAGTWALEQRLAPPDSASSDFFGMAVDVEGDTMLVGASGNDTWGEDAGAVFVYERTASVWDLKQKLRPLNWDLEGTSWGAGAAFGFSVDLSGDLAIVGAVNDGRTGAAYVFRRVGGLWTHEARLEPSDGRGHDLFGYSVAIDEHDAVVGAYDHGRFHVHLDDHAGAVYAFTLGPQGWSDAVELIGDGNPWYWCRGLGHDVLIADGEIIAGAPGALYCSPSNSTYLFRRGPGGWSDPESGRARPFGDSGDDFGSPLALAGSTLLVGAPNDPERGGAVYAYDRDVPGSLSCCPDIGERYCSPAAANPFGNPGRIEARGSVRVGDDCLFLRTEDLLGPGHGFFLMSDSTGLVIPPGHAGPLCLGSGTSGLLRISRPMDTDGGGFTIGLGTRVVPGAGTIVSGSTWYFQAWYRKAQHKNFTDALSVTFL